MVAVDGQRLSRGRVSPSVTGVGSPVGASRETCRSRPAPHRRPTARCPAPWPSRRASQPGDAARRLPVDGPSVDCRSRSLANRSRCPGIGRSGSFGTACSFSASMPTGRVGCALCRVPPVPPHRGRSGAPGRRVALGPVLGPEPRPSVPPFPAGVGEFYSASGGRATHPVKNSPTCFSLSPNGFRLRPGAAVDVGPLACGRRVDTLWTVQVRACVRPGRRSCTTCGSVGT